ncbi:hypothetical protein ACPXCE_22575 [Streptomyces sp. DT24]|uniref:hypothetical protein n=1 Tax=Streptomyces sp. DT24 TaxID=3416520 RepID=UPI003CF7EB9C
MTTPLTRLRNSPAPPRPARSFPSPRRGGRPDGAGRSVWNACAVVVPAAVIAVLSALHSWAGDDALIYTRTVRQILAGNGPVLNTGERVESSTGTLWQWAVAAGGLLTGADPVLVAVVLGAVCTTAGFLWALDGARRFHGGAGHGGAGLGATGYGWSGHGRLLLPAGVLVLLPVRAMWDYGTSGLETGLTFGWLGLSWWLLVRAYDDGSPRVHRVGAVVFGLGPLVRPDLTPVSVVFLFSLWLIVRPGRRTVVGWCAGAAALPCCYEVFRAGFYGVLVPLPGITKEASTSLWGRGWAYLLNFTGPYRLWVPLLLVVCLTVVAVGDRLRTVPGRAAPGVPVVVAAPVLSGLLCALYVTRVGGDFMHGRMLLPPLFLLLLPVFLVPLSRLTGALVAAVGVWAGCCALLWFPPQSGGDGATVIDEHAGYVRATGEAHPVRQSAHSGRRLPFARETAKALTSGRRSLVVELRYDRRFVTLPLTSRIPERLVGAEARLGHSGAVIPLDDRAIDTLGLAHPLGAHLRRTSFTKAGHDKPVDRAWIVADFTDPGVRLPPGIDARRVAAARRALTCGPLAELRAATRDPLTPGRFWHNLTGSWRRTAFRFPADPLDAERELCGRG